MNFHGTWIKGYWGMGTHVTSSQRTSRGHLRSLTPNGQDMCNWSLYPHTLMNFHGTWQKDIRVRAHMWPKLLFLLSYSMYSVRLCIRQSIPSVFTFTFSCTGCIVTFRHNCTLIVLLYHNFPQIIPGRINFTEQRMTTRKIQHFVCLEQWPSKVAGQAVTAVRADGSESST